MQRTKSQAGVNSSRRQFLKTSGAAALGGALASPLAFTQRAAAYSSSDTLNVGLIGCGGRGTGAAAQALSTGEGVILTAMGDVFAHQLQSSRNGLQASEEFGQRV